jgi:hypothetical protein
LSLSALQGLPTRQLRALNSAAARQLDFLVPSDNCAMHDNVRSV